MSLYRLPALFLAALAVVLPMRLWVAEPIYVASPSMEPTLKVGTVLILDKFSLSGRTPRRGEIVSFRSPVGSSHDLIKRVIALPGESVEIRDKRVFVDGRELREPYVVHTRAGERLEGDDLGPLTVPDDGVFVLGDNRDESADSSVWRDPKGARVPFLKLSLIQGVVRRLPWA